MIRQLPLALLVAVGFSLTSVPIIAAEDPAVPKKKSYPLPLLQTIVADGVPYDITVNGFPDDALRSIKEAQSGVEGFAMRMQRYRVLHPYFLRAAGNRLVATYHLNTSFVAHEDPGPWRLDLRVAVVDWPGQLTGDQREYTDRELVRVVSPDLVLADADVRKTMTGTFAWAQPLPVWSWTSGIAIEESEQTKASLYAAYAVFHDRLAALHDPSVLESPAAPAPEPAAAKDLAAQLRVSTREFIQASELRGVPYTFSDELVYAATHLSRRDYDREMTENAARAAKLPPKTKAQEAAEREQREREALEKENVPSLDTPTSRDPEPGPDGRMPPRLALEELRPIAETKLTLLAGGTIARLTSVDANEPLIQFRSNYADGPWGSLGSIKLEADVWFRRDASGNWVIDALWPETGAIEMWGTLDNLLDGLHY